MEEVICPQTLTPCTDEFPNKCWQACTVNLEEKRIALARGVEPERAGREGDTQPLPLPSDAPIAHQLVQEDLQARLELGIKRYGQPLQAFNGRDSLRDAYEEVLDLAVYLRTLIYEQENPNGPS